MKTLLRSRVLAWVLTVAMVVTFMPTMAFATPDSDETSAVASLTSGSSTTYYSSLRNAIADAVAGDTVTLLKDDTTSFSTGGIVLDKTLTIDGNGHVVKGVSYEDLANVGSPAAITDANVHGFYIKSGDVTIEDLTMTEFGDTNFVNKFGIVPILTSTTYDGTLTLNNVDIDKYNRQAICIFGGEFSITGGTINGNAPNFADTDTQKFDHFQQGIEIRGGSGTISGVTIRGMGRKIANPADDFSTVGIVSWSTGNVEINNVDIDVKDVAIDADASTVAITGDDTVVKGGEKALLAEDNGTLNVSAGNYTGAVTEASTGDTINITGGTFSTDISAFVPEGKRAVEDPPGTWTVQDIVTYQLTVIANETVKYDAPTEVGTPITVSDPEVEKVGHTYTGYQSAHYDKFFADGEVYTMPAAADTLTAVYEPNVYTLSYETYGGTIGDPVDSYTYGVGTALPSDVTKEGNTFEGWYSEAEPTYGNLVTEITATDIGDAVFFAKWKEHTYTIHFDPNGGSGQMSNSVNIPYSTKFELPACQFAAPADKQFLEWNTKADGMGQSYTDKAEVSKLTAEDGGVVTLYAIWTAAAYQVRYQATPDATPYANMIYWVEAGAGHVLQNLPTEAGTEANKPKGTWFEGWKIFGDAEGSVYKPDDTIVIDRPTVLMPFWKEFVYTIEYNLDGGEMPLGLDNPTTYTASTPDFKLVAPVKEGYTFEGWTWFENPTEPYIPVEIDCDAQLKDFVFTAHWQPKTYTALYLDAEGEGLNSYQVPCGAEVPVATAPEIEGFTFAGWEPEVPATMPAKDMTFTAKYDKDYTVTYKPNNGGEATKVFTVQEGKKHTVINNPFQPVTGFEFVLWSAAPNGIGVWYMPGEEMTVNSDVTLYAQWLDKNDYTITFDKASSIATGDAPEARTGKMGETFEVEAGTLEAEDTNNYYILSGWKTEDGHYYSIGDTYTIEGNAALTAVWQAFPKTKCFVVYNANGGDNAPIDSNNPYFVPDTAIAASGESMTAPEGMAFVGWTTKPLDNEEAIPIDDPDINDIKWYKPGEAIELTQHGVLTLYAAWQEVPTYKVTYHRNGGSGDSPQDTAKYAEGDTVTLSDGNGIYINSDTTYKYTLGGWTITGSTSPVYPLGSTFTMPDGNVDFDAYWIKTPVEKYRAYYYLQGGAADPAFNPTEPMISGSKFNITETIPVMEGYRFDGWYDWDSEAIFQPGAEMTFLDSDIWLVAEWTKVYTLTYDLNGGSWEIPKTYGGLTGGQTVALPTAEQNPTKVNNTFAGWKDPATGEVYTSDAFTMPERDTILVAQWEPNVYKVTLNTNGGTINSGDVTEYSYGVETTLPTDVTKDGYTFNGWYDVENKLTTEISAEATGPQEFAAGWTENSYTIKYDGNGGSGNVEPDPEQSVVKYTEEFTTAQNSFINTGKTFKEWNTKPDGSGTSYKEGVTASKLTGEADGIGTLYAIWYNSIYNVIYKNVNAAGEATATLIWNQVSGGSEYTIQTLPEDAIVPQEGYVFKGWKLVGDTNGYVYWPDETTIVGMDMTFLAVWKDANTYTVTYRKNAPSDDYPVLGPKPQDESFVAGDYFKVASADNMYINSNDTDSFYWVFNGWNTKKNGNGDAYVSGNEYPVTGDLTLYAQWEKVDKSYASIEYIGNGGEFVPEDENNPYEIGETAVILDGSGMYREGHAFKYWTLTQEDPEIADPQIKPGDTYTFEKGGVVKLYAQWEALTPINVSFDLYGGKGAVPQAEKNYAGGFVILPSAERLNLSHDPDADGTTYQFMGWTPSYDLNAIYPQNSFYDIPETATEDLIFYAAWNKIPPAKYGVVYDLTGGRGPACKDSHSYTVGQNVPIAGAGEDAPTKDGYVFKGWALSETGAETVYPGGTTIPMVEGGLKLYAQWDKLFTITYNANNGQPLYSDGSYVTGTNRTAWDKPVRYGYTFEGWQPSDRHGIIAEKEVFAVENSDIMMTAQWKKNETLPTADMLDGTLAYQYGDYVYHGAAMRDGDNLHYLVQEVNAGEGTGDEGTGDADFYDGIKHDIDRLLGAMHRGGKAETIVYRNKTYIWDDKQNMLGSNWVPAEDFTSLDQRLFEVIWSDYNNPQQGNDGFNLLVDGKEVVVKTSIETNVTNMNGATIELHGTPGVSIAPATATPAVVLTDADKATIAEMKEALANSPYANQYRIDKVVNVDVYFNHVKLNDVQLDHDIIFVIPYEPAMFVGAPDKYMVAQLHGDEFSVTEGSNTSELEQVIPGVAVSSARFSPYAVLAPAENTVSWTNGEGYFFNDNVATSASVPYGESYEYTITIEPGYKLIGVKANGVSQTLVAPEDNNGQLVYSFNSTNGNRLTDITKDIELKADVQKTFAATYHPNGATQGGDFTETLSGTVDYKVLGPDNEALKYQKVVDGVTYTFMGWSEDKYGIGPYYDGDDVIEGLDHNLDLYAQWENLNQYKVIYDKGKAPFASKTIEGYPPDVQTAYIDEQVRLAGYWNTDLSIEEDADWYYVQTGWNTKDDGTGTHYRMGQRYTFDTPENLVLFAEWKAVRKTECYIGYDANGGMNAPEDPLSPYDGYIVGQGDAVATVLGPENMTREGYTFKCWAVDQPDETAKEYNPTDKIALEPGLIILRAVWEEVPTYKVKYQLGLDASDVELPIYVVAPTDSKAYAEGEPVRLADRLPDIPITIEREGTTSMTFGKLVFQYWEVVDSDVDEYYANTTYAMNPQHALENGTVTFKAAWKFVPEELVALRYNLEGGKAPAEPVGAFDTAAYNVGDEVTVSTATPTKEGYTLEGWSDGTTFYPAGNKFNITEDTTLSAVWTPAWNLNYVTTNPAAGTSETAVAGPYEAGTNVVVGNKPADVEGYRFVGWEYGDALYIPGNTFTMPGNDAFLISKWAEVDKYYVSYDSGFGNPIVHEGPYEAESKIYVAGAPTKEGYSFLGWRNGDKLYTANELFTMPAEDVTFTAEWSQNYKVTYYANNGTDATFADPESTNENYTVRGIGEWTKAVEGRGDQFYTFMGWSTRIDGYGDYYSPSDKIDLTGDLDLYAQWENLNEYTVTYNKGKAPFESKTIVGHAPSDQTGYIDETIRLADSTMFIEEDADWFYVQTGWNTAVDGTGKHYRFGQRYTFDKPEGLVLYAEWQAVRKTDCYIRYDANGGMNAPEDANSPYTGYVQGQGDAFATVLGPEDMTKEGYTFKNWTLDPENAEAPTFNPTDNIALAPGIITLYAQWDKVPTYKVNYKVDGTGENYGVNNPITDSKIYTEGELVRLASGIGLTKDPKVVDDVVVAKYVFAGWLVDGSTVDKYLPGSLYTVNKDHATPNGAVGSDYIVTFVPAWIEVPVDVYVVNYNLNGGSSDSDELKPAEYNSGQTVTVASDTPVKDGYRFDHWDYGDTEYYKGDTFKIEDQDVTLTAHWKKLHSIGFKDDVLSAVEYIAGSFAEGDQIQLNDKPGKANYTFLGWVYDGVTYAAKELFNMVDDDVIFTASWARNYTVTYFANNGTEDFFIETPESNTGYTVSVVPIGWKKSVDDIHQYTFTGWNTQPTGHGDSYTAGEVLTEDLSRDLKLYAQWEDQNVYKVNYHKGKYGDKEIKGALPSSKTGKVGDSFIVAPSDLFIAPDEENFYRFLGWNTNIDGAGDPYYPFMTYTFGAQDVTLFAQWEAIPKTSAYITYNANGGFNAPIDNEVYYANPTAQIRVSGPENMEKPGYTFSHWVDENQKRYDPKDRINLPPGETILYAVWNEIPTYGVSYDTVEGVWGTPPSDSKKYAEGQAVLLPSTADLIKPATDDCTYVLDGWMVANSTSTVYGLGDIYIMNPYDVNEADDKVHFIPHWNEVKIPKLSVVYDFNGGTVPLNVVDQFLGKTYKEGATFYVPSAKPGRTGYQFQGWYNNADGRTYQPNALVNVGDQDITMIAVWEPIYTITYVIVDPSDASHSVRWTEDDPAIYKENEKFWVRHLNEITTGFSDIEHSFTGWKDRAGNEYTPNLDYTMGTSSLVLYAQWDKDYTVKFDLGEVSYLADLSQDKPADQTPVHVGDKVQQVTIPLEYTDENTHVTYYFAGWQWTDKNNNNFNWNFEWPLQQDHFDVNDVMTLTAQWTTTQSYQIIYDACVPTAFKEYLTVEWNGVRVEDLLVPYETVERQDTLHLPVGFVAQNAIITADNLAMFTRNSYKFDGWYLTPDCYEGTEYDMTKTVEENDPNGIYRIDNPYDTDLSNGKQKALILYAKWTSTYAEEGVHVADAKLADGTYAVYYEDKVRAISNDKYLDHVERNFIEVDQYGNPMGLQDNGTSRSNLPPGLKLDPLSGKISGVPTVAGTYTFWIELEDEDQGEQFNDPAQITIVINPMKFNADFTGDFWKYYGDLDPAAPKHSNEMKISVGEQTAILDNQNVGTILLDSDTTVPQTYHKTTVTVTASDENNTVEVRYHTENAIDLVDTFTLPVEREAGENVGKYHMFLDPANVSVTNKDTIKDVSANYEITVGEGLDKDKDAGYLEIKPAPFTFELGDSDDKGKTYGQTDSLTSNLIAVYPSPSASGVVSSAANQTLTVTFNNGIVDKLNLGLTRETLKEDAGKYKLYLDEENINGIEINGEEGDVNIGNYAFTISEAFSTKALTETTAAKYIYTIAKAILSGTNNAEYVYGEVADTVPLMAEGLVDNADISIKDAVNAVVVGKQFLSTSGHLIVGTFRSTTLGELEIAVTNESYEPDQTTSQNTTANYDSSVTAEVKVTARPLKVQGNDITVHKGETKDVMKERLAGIIGLDTVLEGDDVTPDMTFTYGEKTDVGFDEFAEDMYNIATTATESSIIKVAIDVALAGADKDNYTADKTSANVDVSIEIKKNIAGMEITLNPDAPYTYNGEQIKPTVTVIDPDTGEVVPATEYTVEYGPNTNVNDGVKVTITANPDSEIVAGQKKVSETMDKADISPKVSMSNYQEGSVPSIPTVTEGNPGNGSVTYSYKPMSAPDEDYGPNAPTTKGNYTVRAVVGATANYNGGTATANFQVTEKSEPGPGPGPGPGPSPTEEYTITVNKVSNGNAVSDKATAEAGDKVTITTTPAAGYKTVSVRVQDKKGKEVAVTAVDKTTYTFKMPSSDVTVTPYFDKRKPMDDYSTKYKECKHDEECPMYAYSDLKEKLNEWFHDGIHFCLENGIMKGYEDMTFRETLPTTRAELVTMLWNTQGKPDQGKDLSFTDTPSDAWYYDAVRWGVDTKIVNGYEDNTFRPNNPVSRQELAKLLYGFAKANGFDVSDSASIDGFNDRADVGPWAVPYLEWAVGAGLIQGRDGNMLAPTDNASRAEVATIMMRFCVKYTSN